MSIRVMFSIAGLTVREALANKLMWGVLALALGALALAQFGAAMSLTQAESTRAVLAASLLRWGCVTLLTLFVASALGREAQDRWLEVLMALPLRRFELLLARLMGFGLVAIALAMFAGASLALVAPLARTVLWTSAFAGELLLVTTFTIFCMSSLRNLTLSVCAVMAFYVLGRVIAAAQLIAHTPITEPGPLQVVAQWIIDLLALVLPRLDQFANAAWLTGEAPDVSLGALAVQVVIYVGLLTSATLFDLHRRNF